MSEVNEHGLPVGPLIAGWSGAKRPGGTVLIGRTVRLEPLHISHAAELLSAFSTAPDGHWTYMPWGPFASAEDYKAWTRRAVEDDHVQFYSLCPTGAGPLGVAGYLAIEPSMGSIEVGGITFSPALQGTVEATEAMYLMMAHAFDDLGYRRYEWKCDALNEPSRKAAERLGFVYEGTFEQHRVVRGRNRDTAWFGMTDARWASEDGPTLRAWLSPDNFDSVGRQRRSLSEVRGDGTFSAT